MSTPIYTCQDDHEPVAYTVQECPVCAVKGSGEQISLIKETLEIRDGEVNDLEDENKGLERQVEALELRIKELEPKIP